MPLASFPPLCDHLARTTCWVRNTESGSGRARHSRVPRRASYIVSQDKVSGVETKAVLVCAAKFRATRRTLLRVCPSEPSSEYDTLHHATSAGRAAFYRGSFCGDPPCGKQSHRPAPASQHLPPSNLEPLQTQHPGGGADDWQGRYVPNSLTFRIWDLLLPAWVETGTLA